MSEVQRGHSSSPGKSLAAGPICATRDDEPRRAVLVPLLPTKYVRSWPKHPDAPRVKYVPVSRALSLRSTTDTHLAAFSAADIPHRLCRDVLATYQDGVRMVLLVVAEDDSGGAALWVKRGLGLLMLALATAYAFAIYRHGWSTPLLLRGGGWLFLGSALVEREMGPRGGGLARVANAWQSERRTFRLVSGLLTLVGHTAYVVHLFGAQGFLVDYEFVRGLRRHNETAAAPIAADPPQPGEVPAQPLPLRDPCEGKKDDCREFMAMFAEFKLVHAGLVERGETGVFRDSDVGEAERALALAKRLKATACAQDSSVAEFCEDFKLIAPQVRDTRNRIRDYMRRYSHVDQGGSQGQDARGPAVEQASVLVESWPSGADIVLAGARLGETPAAVKLEKGVPVTVTLVKNGYETARLTLDGSESKVTQVLTKIKAGGGTDPNELE